MQLTGAITRGFKYNYPSITFYSPFHTHTHTLFLASVETLVVGLSPAEKQGPSPCCLLVRSRVKLSSRFGLFPGRTGTSCHRRFLKEHTSSLSLSICTHAKTKKTKTQNNALSHGETCQSTGSLFPAVEPTAIRNPLGLLLHEFLFFTFALLFAARCLFVFFC